MAATLHLPRRTRQERHLGQHQRQGVTMKLTATAGKPAPAGKPKKLQYGVPNAPLPPKPKLCGGKK